MDKLKSGAALLLVVALLGGSVSVFGADKPRNFKNWVRTCADIQGGKKQVCTLIQHLNMKDTGRRILSINIQKLPQEKASVTLSLPLGVDLLQGAVVAVDKLKPFKVPFRVCLNNGCHITLTGDSKWLASMKKGNQFTVTFANRQGKKFTIPVSLSGFTAGFNSL
jgi:invasion protein IalB